MKKIRLFLKLFFGFAAPILGWLLLHFQNWQYIFLFWWFLILCPFAILISIREIINNDESRRGQYCFIPKNIWLANSLVVVTLMGTQLETMFIMFVLGPT